MIGSYCYAIIRLTIVEMQTPRKKTSNDKRHLGQTIHAGYVQQKVFSNPICVFFFKVNIAIVHLHDNSGQF